MKKILLKILVVILFFILSIVVLAEKEKGNDLKKLTNLLTNNTKVEKIDNGSDEVLVMYYSTKNETYHISISIEKETKIAKGIWISHTVFDTKQIIPMNNLYQFKNFREEGYQKGKVIFEENIYDYLIDGEIDIFRIFTRSGELDFGYVIRKGVIVAQDTFRDTTKKEERMMMSKYRNIVKTILKHYGRQ
ncbi:MAG: hypothetical protein UT05_C0003G0021 [Parcubacteria group bacterium GW2011_GWF2_38_76]|nr:MAG: hypothetical protein UT05_C0003G0021 [Parcubacteria group bacterium GW2011_GWF2_38_76]HBM46205.1 hypothetical protein [Patescibacteria group bacterium]